MTINDIVSDACLAQAENCKLNGVPFIADSSCINATPTATSTSTIGVDEVNPNGDNSSSSGGTGASAVLHTGDAINFMYSRKPGNNSTQTDAFDVIDLDPYGTAAPFLDSAVSSVADGGLLNITCTDMAVLSGNFPEKCFSLYGTVGLKAKFYHEASLRTLLHAIDSAANKHGRYIVSIVFCFDFVLYCTVL